MTAADDDETIIRAGDAATIPARELWRYRELWLFFVWRDLKLRYKQTMLGAAWVVLQPLSTTIVFVLLFSRLGRLPTDSLPEPVFYFTGLLAWTYLAQCAALGSNALVQQQNIITKVYFPRALMPLATATTPLVDLAVGLVVLASILAWHGVRPTLGLLALPAVLLQTALVGTGVAVGLSALHARFRDLRQVLALFIQLWMFSSPVVYPLSMIPPEWRLLYGANPAVLSIEGLRWAVTGTSALTPAVALVSVAATFALLIASAALFRRIERMLADVL